MAFGVAPIVICPRAPLGSNAASPGTGRLRLRVSILLTLLPGHAVAGPFFRVCSNEVQGSREGPFVPGHGDRSNLARHPRPDNRMGDNTKPGEPHLHAI